MKISNQNQEIAFCQLVPTEPLLKTIVKTSKFEDAKILNKAIGVNYSGHISFYIRAAKIADEIIEKNPNIAGIVSDLKKITDLQTQQREIKRIITEYGEYIDVQI